MQQQHFLLSFILCPDYHLSSTISATCYSLGIHQKTRVIPQDAAVLITYDVAFIIKPSCHMYRQILIPADEAMLDKYVSIKEITLFYSTFTQNEPPLLMLCFQLNGILTVAEQCNILPGIFIPCLVLQKFAVESELGHNVMKITFEDFCCTTQNCFHFSVIELA